MLTNLHKLQPTKYTNLVTFAQNKEVLSFSITLSHYETGQTRQSLPTFGNLLPSTLKGLFLVFATCKMRPWHKGRLCGRGSPTASWEHSLLPRWEGGRRCNMRGCTCGRFTLKEKGRCRLVHGTSSHLRAPPSHCDKAVVISGVRNPRVLGRGKGTK
ncbi:hypothetical protein AVEN_267816-1 [Araneus ventricosus]|uniref:Uncharacterized protein n=1 Tax=Araneus ventricosus TaxID=182803 RepID=A0A4Y2D6P2_ARAVE|nr:hypothetical protein AVEN_267816-1 [Araneus ventricosus]